MCLQSVQKSNLQTKTYSLMVTAEIKENLKGISVWKAIRYFHMKENSYEN